MLFLLLSCFLPSFTIEKFLIGNLAIDQEKETYIQKEAGKDPLKNHYEKYPSWDPPPKKSPKRPFEATIT